MKSFIWISQKYDKGGDLVITRHFKGESLEDTISNVIKENMYEDPLEIEFLFDIDEDQAESMSGEEVFNHVKERTSEYSKVGEFAVTIWDITDPHSPKVILEPTY